MESCVQLRKGTTPHRNVDYDEIAIDTRRRLRPSPDVLANDLGQH